jgi:probable rRNA maturation factor
VLSWPTEDLAAAEPGGQPQLPEADVTGEIQLGDLAIAYDTCAREANDANKPLSDHLRHLVVHGVLHLLGYDHIRDLDATVMEALEVEILGNMGLDNPYTINGSL